MGSHTFFAFSTRRVAASQRRHGGAVRAVWRRAMAPRPVVAVALATAGAGVMGLVMVAVAAGGWPGETVQWAPAIDTPFDVQDSVVATGIVFGVGLVLVCGGWFALVNLAGRGTLSRVSALVLVAVVGAAWVAPMMLSDPLLSRDAYSYAAQGEVAARGLDPTAVGPSVLGNGPFVDSVDPTWRDAPAPYGPLAIGVQELAVIAAGHEVSGSVAMMRLVSVVGVIMAAIGAGIIARQHKVPLALALATGIASPLVVIYLIGGSHNDALMMGFLTLGMAAFGAQRRVWAVAAVIAATAVKLPAAAGLVFIGWSWIGPGALMLRNRLCAIAGVALAAAGALIVMSRVVGVGFGWLTALSSTGSNDTTFSVTTKLGLVAGDLAELAGIKGATSLFVGGFRLAGLGVAAVLAMWLLVNSERIGVVRALGLAMVVAVVLGPVVLPWYLPAGLVLIAATGLGQRRSLYLVFVAATTALVWPAAMNSGSRPVGLVVHLGELAVIVAIVALCIVTAQGSFAAGGPHRWVSRWQPNPMATADRLDGREEFGESNMRA